MVGSRQKLDSGPLANPFGESMLMKLNRYPSSLPSLPAQPGEFQYRNSVLESSPAGERSWLREQCSSGTATPAKMAEGILTVDVEDWFHILDIGGPQIDQWDNLPSRVEQNFIRLLDLFSQKKASTTCFFLGWVAKRFPHLVKEAVSRGHEVASHGYMHRLTNELTREQFYEDVLRARLVLEEITGTPVSGYRAPGFSTAEWFFDTLAEAGYRYDSSIFPAPHGHGGRPNSPREFHTIPCRNGQTLFEFPITVADVLGKPVCVSGGGYMRLFPYWFIRLKSREVVKQGRPVIFYIHPREIDPDQPRMPMSAYRRFKSYVNISSTEAKLARILDDFRVSTFQQYLMSSDQGGLKQ
jgi:polysaccharide deacetylase family protein (PEP-CTERM system associated)